MTSTLDTAVGYGFDATIADRPQEWRVRVDDELQALLVRAGRALADRPLPAITLDDVDAGDGELERLADLAAAILRCVHHESGGPGFALVERLPARALSEGELRALYWLIGLAVGRPVTQNRAASLIGDVRLTTTSGYRGYNTSKGGGFHCDFTDLGALLSRRRARSGGTSSIVSAAFVHDRVLDEAPDLLRIAYQPFALGRLREEDPEDVPYSWHPIFARDAQRFGMFYNPTLIRQAQEYDEVPRLTEAQEQVCALIDDVVHRRGVAFERLLEEGEIIFFNNHQVLHSRSSFDDFEEPDERRHLLRIWLEVAPLRDEAPQPVRYDYRFGRTGLGPEEV